MEEKALSASKNEPLVSFKGADILNGESPVIYELSHGDARRTSSTSSGRSEPAGAAR